MQMTAQRRTNRRNFVLLCPLSTKLTPRTCTQLRFSQDINNSAGAIIPATAGIQTSGFLQ
jgi:hypothetical protein